MCVLLATLVCVILVSPVVSSPPTTPRSKHAPPAMHVMLAPSLALQMEQAIAASAPADVVAVAFSGRDLVDLTSSRLC